MRVFLSILLILGLVDLAAARPASAPPKHPAVVRIIVKDGGSSLSLGSGALVAVSEQYGLVVTNWHVVRDGNGTATVVFPDGFSSPATVARVDRDWDLAALVIWRPRVQPIPLGNQRPEIGEPLWIAGYGKGSYRMVSGQCTQYLSPGRKLPFDMIELSAGARQGDSGGPILNQQGELAGVLFGAAWGKTSGSHCLRVRQFLDPVLHRFDSMPMHDPTMIARGDQPAVRDGAVGDGSRAAPTATIAARHGEVGDRTDAIASRDDWRGGAVGAPRAEGSDLEARSTPWMSSSPHDATFPAGAAPSQRTIPHEPIRSDPWDQGRNLLAIIGLAALCFHGLRWLAA
ncbi:MAG: trypsin-like peptidase domain-containing protein [Pirellulaceae bacterium]|nr:trypsin-like peptidase domain-containing protein [Pirellulaceae bacterium]